MRDEMKRNKKLQHEIARATGYDYSSREARERTAANLFAKARIARAPAERDWETYNDYYNFIHDASDEMRRSYEEKGLEFDPAVIPDPYIAVETQIQTTVPQPEFRGRDDDKDSEKAKKREYAVRFVCENNRMDDMNTSNERRLVKLGDAFWKVYWDPTMKAGLDEGDIRIEDVPVEAVYVDPACREKGMQAGQYVIHLYRMHKVRFCNCYAKELQKLGIEPDEVMSTDYSSELKLFDMTSGVNDEEDTVTVLEHWFKQPFPVTVQGRRIEAGTVACSILVGGKEIKYIPQYWENTGRQNHLFPFVHYWRIRDENQFYNKSELFAIKDMVDAADRKLGMAIGNDAMVSNDIILAEQGAFADGSGPSNEPGAVWELKQGKVNAVRRLGGLQPIQDAVGGTEWFLRQIQRANRNYETNQGAEASRQTTATALSMMRADAAAQDEIKVADRNRGFERLYELIDWSCLEFYDTDRLIFIGAKKKDDNPVSFTFNSAAMSRMLPPVYDYQQPDKIVREEQEYWPRVDVTVTAGEGIIKGKQATLRALEGIAQMNVTPQNWKIIAAQLEILDIPNKKEIVESWRLQFEGPPTPPVMQGMANGSSAPVEGVPQDAGFEQLPTLPGTEGVT